MKSLSIKKVMLMVAPMCVIVVIALAIKNNPSAGESHTKLMIMQTEIGSLLRLGGIVIDRKSNAKYGGAIATVDLTPGSWNAVAFQNELVKRNWTRLNEDPSLFCKELILLKIEDNAAVVEGRRASSIVMTFNSGTVSDCGVIQR